ncbi:MICOS complex subunit MIC25 isoform 4-T7 [Lycaon pictus]
MGEIHRAGSTGKGYGASLSCVPCSHNICVFTNLEALQIQLFWNETGARELESREAELNRRDTFYKEQLGRLEKKNAEMYKLSSQQFHEAASKMEGTINTGKDQDSVSTERSLQAREETEAWPVTALHTVDHVGSLQVAWTYGLAALCPCRPRRIEPVCSGLQAQILHCYRDHLQEVLLCSDLVKAYQHCVSAAHKG